jgi:hypothetical protein
VGSGVLSIFFIGFIMKFCTILKQQFDYARNSIRWMDYCTAYDTIEIVDHAGNDLFLQGDEAQTLLDRARDMVKNRFTDETFENCLILCLYPYVDLLGN